MFALLCNELIAQSCDISPAGSASIGVGQSKTFSVSASSGVTYSWYVNNVSGTVSIVGSSTSTSVVVKATKSGTAQICVKKYKNGLQVCCVCTTITCTSSCPTPTLNLFACGSSHPFWRFRIGGIDIYNTSTTYAWSSDYGTIQDGGGTRDFYANINPRSFPFYVRVVVTVPGCAPKTITKTYYQSDCIGDTSNKGARIGSNASTKTIDSTTILRKENILDLPFEGKVFVEAQSLVDLSVVRITKFDVEGTNRRLPIDGNLLHKREPYVIRIYKDGEIEETRKIILLD